MCERDIGRFAVLFTALTQPKINTDCVATIQSKSLTVNQVCVLQRGKKNHPSNKKGIFTAVLPDGIMIHSLNIMLMKKVTMFFTLSSKSLMSKVLISLAIKSL